MVNGRLVLDQSASDAMVDQKVLLVNGPIRLTAVLPEENLRQKISLLVAADGIVCCEENLAVLKSLLSTREGRESEITLIPAGYQLIEKPLTLDKAALGAIKNGKLYCTQSVFIPLQVEAELLDEKVTSLISKDRVFCPQDLTDVGKIPQKTGRDDRPAGLERKSRNVEKLRPRKFYHEPSSTTSSNRCPAFLYFLIALIAS